MDWETARRWLEIMAKNVFDPNQPAYIVVLQRVEELEAALKLGAEAYVAALPDASTDAMTDLTIERNALRHEIERLREDNNALWHRFQSCPACGEAGCECRARGAAILAEEMEARVRTLEGALRRIEELGYDAINDLTRVPETEIVHMITEARAALRKEGK